MAPNAHSAPSGPSVPRHGAPGATGASPCARGLRAPPTVSSRVASPLGLSPSGLARSPPLPFASGRSALARRLFGARPRALFGLLSREEEDPGISVGIDLGTTHSAVAWVRPDGVVEAVPVCGTSFLLPSVAAVREPADAGAFERLLVGDEALKAARGRPECLARSTKRLLGASLRDVRRDLRARDGRAGAPASPPSGGSAPDAVVGRAGCVGAVHGIRGLSNVGGGFEGRGAARTRARGRSGRAARADGAGDWGALGAPELGEWLGEGLGEPAAALVVPLSVPRAEVERLRLQWDDDGGRRRAGGSRPPPLVPPPYVALEPRVVATALLARLRSAAAAWTGRRAARAIISVPARFSTAACSETERAALAAGFERVQLVREPSAAALAHGAGAAGEGTILVLDLGGGTFDASLVLREGGAIEVVASEGDLWLGGDDVDEAVADWAVRESRALDAVAARAEPAGRGARADTRGERRPPAPPGKALQRVYAHWRSLFPTLAADVDAQAERAKVQVASLQAGGRVGVWVEAPPNGEGAADGGGATSGSGAASGGGATSGSGAASGGGATSGSGAASGEGGAASIGTAPSVGTASSGGAPLAGSARSRRAGGRAKKGAKIRIDVGEFVEGAKGLSCASVTLTPRQLEALALPVLARAEGPVRRVLWAGGIDTSVERGRADERRAHRRRRRAARGAFEADEQEAEEVWDEVATLWEAAEGGGVEEVEDGRAGGGGGKEDAPSPPGLLGVPLAVGRGVVDAVAGLFGARRREGAEGDGEAGVAAGPAAGAVVRPSPSLVPPSSALPTVVLPRPARAPGAPPSGRDPSVLGAVLLAGGSSGLPTWRSLARRWTGLEPWPSQVRPDLAVALGAALRAHALDVDASGGEGGPLRWAPGVLSRGARSGARRDAARAVGGTPAAHVLASPETPLIVDEWRASFAAGVARALESRRDGGGGEEDDEDGTP